MDVIHIVFGTIGLLVLSEILTLWCFFIERRRARAKSLEVNVLQGDLRRTREESGNAETLAGEVKRLNDVLSVRNERIRELEAEVIHIEEQAPPKKDVVGDYAKIWGDPIKRTRVKGAKGPVKN